VEWQELEFTVFFHFGINTFAGLEWGKKDMSPTLFNPTSLDARQWIRVSKEAGAKLAILVARHHDGFCNWPSARTEYSVKNSPWRGGKGDLVKEVSDACREYGMKFGLYLSPWDIHSELYGTPEYNVYFMNLLTEVLSNYGKVDEVWFDGACGEGPNGKKQVYDWDAFYRLVRKLQPGAVIAVTGPDIRWVGTESGYGRETEWSVVPLHDTAGSHCSDRTTKIPEECDPFLPRIDPMKQDLGSRDMLRGSRALIWYPSEVDVSIRPGWFYHPEEDSLVKSPVKLAEIYFSSVGRNSVLLLNIPPDRRGLINEADVKSLRGMRALLDSAFKDNLAKGSGIAASGGKTGCNPALMTDGDPLSWWTTGKGITTSAVTIKFGRPKKINCIALQENFRNGQRVEKFALDASVRGEWKQINEGTTIGYKRLLKFPEVAADAIRLRILSSRDCPEISEIAVYELPAGIE
jgi:alpha-L-fucosidase